MPPSDAGEHGRGCSFCRNRAVCSPLRPCGPPLPHAGEAVTYRLRFGSPACGGAGERSETERAACGKAAAIFCSAGPEGEGGCFDSPSLPPLDSLPTHSDQGMSPWTQKRKVAAGICLKKCHHSHPLAHFFRAAYPRRSDCVCAPCGRAWRVPLQFLQFLQNEHPLRGPEGVSKL